jgi:hypothetical protein
MLAEHEKKHNSKREFAIYLDAILKKVDDGDATVSELVEFVAVTENDKTIWQDTELHTIVYRLIDTVTGLITLPEQDEAPFDAYDAFAMLNKENRSF